MKSGDEMRILRELESLHENLEKAETKEEKDMINSQIKNLNDLLKKITRGKFDVGEKKKFKPLPSGKKLKIVKKVKIKKPVQEKSVKTKSGSLKSFKLSEFEKETLRRLRRKEKKIVKKKFKKPSKYVNVANKIFADYADKLVRKGDFRKLERDLAKTTLQFLPKTYVAMILFSTLLSIGVGFCIFVFFLFFNIGAELPFITLIDENFGIRFLKVFWILFAVPLATFVFLYFYPSLERKSAETKINHELPFATIHMSSISGSMVEPSKIFEIIISTHEYPYLEKEFRKLINQINVLGYDLVTALRNSAFNSPSKKLSELFNGLATTINSGGNLPEFFEKRSQTLLFEYRLEREKKTRAAETFMDIYISVVIAAPMVLMLLLMMMKISGLGIALSTSAITLIMVLGVGVINVAFLTFLHLRGAGE